jgi:hypothetical protein
MITRKSIVPSKYLENSLTTQYTVSNGTLIIESPTFTNITASNVTFDVYIVPSGGSAGDSNRVIKSKSVAPSESYEATALFGKILTSGQFIATNCSAANAIVCNIGGSEIT